MLSSVASMIDQFNMENIRILQLLGYKVDVACNFSYGSTCSKQRVEEFKTELSDKNIKYYNIPIPRSAHSIVKMITAYQQIRRLLYNNNYQVVHCHSPIGGALCRLASKKYRNIGMKVIYTAHGFHFYNGASFLNWLCYYPIEKILSGNTDALITINSEDYSFAKTRMVTTNIFYIPGIGIDSFKYEQIVINTSQMRKEIDIPESSIVLFSVGEINKNKNHKIIIEALAKLKNSDIHYVIAGKGPLEGYLKKRSKNLGISSKVHFLGYRRDIAKLLKIADIFCFPSFREGMPISALEAMASGLPLIASNIRGIKDCCQDNVTGILCSPNNVTDYLNAIERLANNKKERIRMGVAGSLAAKKYDKSNVNRIMNKIYSAI